MKRKTIIAFGGQGRQRFERAACLRKVRPFANALHLASQAFELDFEEIMWGASTESLNARNDLLQPAIFAFGWSLFQAMRPYIYDVACLVGHSLGEVVALACAEALSLPDAAQFVKLRGREMQALAVKTSQDMLTLRCANIVHLRPRISAHGVFVANDNGGGQYVLAGETKRLLTLQDELATEGMSCDILGTRIGFHTPLIKQAELQLRRLLPRLQFQRPRWPFFSVLANRLVSDPDELRALMAVHATSPVSWKAAMRTLTGEVVAGSRPGC